jgi:hypothetical protein
VIQRPRKNYAQKAVMWVEVPYREFENAARVLRWCTFYTRFECSFSRFHSFRVWFYSERRHGMI